MPAGGGGRVVLPSADRPAHAGHRHPRQYYELFNLYAPPSLAFCHLLKIILRHPYLKILDLANLFVSDAPMKKKIKKFSFTPLSGTLKYGSENRPWVRGLPQITTFIYGPRRAIPARLGLLQGKL